MCRAHLPTVLNTHNSMDLIFNHRFGLVEQQDLVVCDVLAVPDQHDEADMVESGWLALDRPYHIYDRDMEVFYQCRSTRIDLSKQPRSGTEHTHNDLPVFMKEIFPRHRDDTVWTGMHQLYAEYIQRKGFRDLYNPFDHVSHRDSFLIFYSDTLDTLLGFTKIKRYHWQEHFYNDYNDEVTAVYPEGEPHGIESVMHCNRSPISQLTMEMEMAWAKQQNAAYYYAGAGYEKSSMYKSRHRGFEWWTGTKWSRSKREYRRLCKRDSELRSIADLGNAK